MEIGIDASGKTVKAAMGSMDYHKCLACWAGAQFEQYPKQYEWERVRFNDELYSGFGLEHQLRCARKPGEQYCSECIQRIKEPKDTDLKQQHSWSAVGNKFKGPIVFFEVPSNTNGRRPLQVYKDYILEPYVKPWIEAGHDFVLEEDGDSGHGTGKKNIVRTWKQQNGLIYFFNCANSPDLSPFENCWQAPKQHVKKYPHWDDATTRESIWEGWDILTQ